MTLDRFLNLVFTWIGQRTDPEKYEKWIEELNAPMPVAIHGGPAPRVSRRQIDQEKADFAQAM